VLKECPVGKVLREAPHIYDLIDHLSHAEHASPSEMQSHSRYFVHALRLFRAETSRLDELRMESRSGSTEAHADAEFGRQVLRGRA